VALARQVGAAGDPNRALTLAREIDAEATATLGADHEITLSARFEIAHWTREVDGAAAAAEGYAKLIEQMEALEPEPWSAITDVMWNLGSCLSDVGDHARAVQISAAAIEQARQAYGDTHIRVLRMRLTHIEWSDRQATLGLRPHLAAGWPVTAPNSSANRTSPPLRPGTSWRIGPPQQVTQKQPYRSTTCSKPTWASSLTMIIGSHSRTAQSLPISNSKAAQHARIGSYPTMGPTVTHECSPYGTASS
jgi:hypothetical protein